MSVVNPNQFCRFATPRPIFYGLLLALCCLAPQRGAALPLDGRPLSQRRINELAAALLRARLTLIEETGLRRPQEPLPAYFLRVAGVMPGETSAARQMRIVAFLGALTAAEKETASIHAVPTLLHDTPDNRRQWGRATGALSLLPGRIQKVRSAWQAVQQEERRDGQPPVGGAASGPCRRLGAELTETVEQILVAYNALRDVTP